MIEYEVFCNWRYVNVYYRGYLSNKYALEAKIIDELAMYRFTFTFIYQPISTHYTHVAIACKRLL